MKINKINTTFYNYSYAKNYKISKNNATFKGAAKAEPAPLYAIKSAFMTDKDRDAKLKSENIKNRFARVNKEIEELKETGKEIREFKNEVWQEGLAQGFHKPLIIKGEDADMDIVFKNFNKENGYPDNFQIRTYKNSNGKPVILAEISGLSSDNAYSMRDFSDSESESFYIMTGNRIVSKTKKYNNGYFEDLLVEKNGFTKQRGFMNDKNTIEDVIELLVYDSKDPLECKYSVKKHDGIQKYQFNDKADMWQKIK